MEEKQDKASVGMKILSFLIPLVGLILFISKKKEKPGYAKGCGIAALIGFIIGMVVVLPVTLVVMAIFSTGLSIVNNVSTTLNSASSLSATETMAYNFKFEKYKGTISGSKVKELLNTVSANNRSQNAVSVLSDEGTVVSVVLDGSTVDVTESVSKIKVGVTYEVKMEYNYAGLVNKILITTKNTSSSSNTIGNTNSTSTNSIVGNTITNSIDSTNTVTNTLVNTSGTIANTLENSANTLTDALETSTDVLTNTLTDAAGTLSNTLSSLGW